MQNKMLQVYLQGMNKHNFNLSNVTILSIPLGPRLVRIASLTAEILKSI